MDGDRRAPRPDTRARALTSTDLRHLVVLGILLVVTPIAMRRGTASWWLPSTYIVMALLLLAVVRLHDLRPGSRALAAIHLWYPVLYVTIVFWTLVAIVPALSGGVWRDEVLARWDLAIVGADPAAWMTRWEHPLLTDVLHVFYAIYFVLPVILIAVLIRGPRVALGETVFVLCFAFYLCYLGYVMVPAAGPRYAIHGTNVMEGWIVTQPIRDAIDALEPNKADVFPSAHAAITLVVQALALRHAPRLGRALIPVTLVILVSLVYARYHYVVDVIAGVLWAAVTLLVAPRLHVAWERWRAAHPRSEGDLVEAA